MNPIISILQSRNQIMGNKLGKNEDEFEKMVKSMKSKQNQSAGTQTKITINP